MGLVTEISNCRIRAVSCAVPETQSDNSEFYEEFGADNVERFRKTTGVKTRRIAGGGQTSSDFAEAAVKQIFAAGMVSPEEIDGIVFVSQTPDYLIPATACRLHGKLGLKKECLAFDVNLGCSGFVYGLYVAASLLREGKITKVILCGGDTITKCLSPHDRGSAMLFGDGGFAVLIEQDASSPVWHCSFGTDGSGYDVICVPGGGFRNRNCDREGHLCEDGVFRTEEQLIMKGLDVFNFSLETVPPVIKEVAKNAGNDIADYDAVVLHQANLFMLKQIAMLTKFKKDRMPVSIDEYGNTSVTSIPLTLCHAIAGKEEKQWKLMLAGFGVGLSWGAISTTISTEACLPVIFLKDTEI